MSQDHWILHRIQQNQGSVFANVTKARRKLETYCLLQAALFNLDVATEPDYQKKYIWLYGMRRQPINWLNSYFSLLQAKKGNNAVSFTDILPTLSTPVCRQRLSEFCGQFLMDTSVALSLPAGPMVVLSLL